MAWLIAFVVVVFLAALTGVFIAAARAIRRDLTDRFDRIRVQLERDANALVQHLLNGHE